MLLMLLETQCLQKKLKAKKITNEINKNSINKEFNEIVGNKTLISEIISIIFLNFKEKIFL